MAVQLRSMGRAEHFSVITMLTQHALNGKRIAWRNLDNVCKVVSLHFNYKSLQYILQLRKIKLVTASHHLIEYGLATSALSDGDAAELHGNPLLKPIN